MLYTITPPTRQGERIRLYPTLGAAQAHAPDGQAVHAVAVTLDGRGRSLISAWRQVEPAWTTPVEVHDDGSATAHGPIPDRLFVN